MIFTILAYKSDGEDVCMGCVMNRYGSDFRWKSSMDRKEMSVFLSELLFEDMHRSTGEDTYEYTFLINGEEHKGWPEDLIIEEIRTNAKILADAKDKAAKEKKQTEDDARAKREEEAQEQRERRQLAELQNKYKV